MEITESGYLDLLKQKLDILNDMLVLTESMNFFDKDVSIDEHTGNYYALYEKRAPMLEQAARLDDRLSSEEYKLFAESGSERFVKEYESLTLKIKEVVRGILELDEKNKTAAEGFMSFVKNNIRDIKIGRNVNTLYQTEIVADSGIYFDKKK